MFRILILVSYPLDAAAIGAACWMWRQLRKERAVNSRRTAWQRKVRDWRLTDAPWVIR